MIKLMDGYVSKERCQQTDGQNDNSKRNLHQKFETFICMVTKKMFFPKKYSNGRMDIWD